MSKDEKLFRQGTRRLYAEIDLLDMVKQLRITKFMSSFLLNRNQRELVKFMHQYTLISRIPTSKGRGMR